MTASEISIQFDVLYNNLTNYEGSSFSAKEKSILLTYAQLQILEKYYPIADLNEENKRYLIPLKSNPTSCTVSGTGEYPNARNFIVPSDHKYTVSEYCTLTYNGTSDCHSNGDTEVCYWIKDITEDYYGANISNPFKKPYNNLVWRLDRWDSTKVGNEKRIRMLIGDSTFTISAYTIVYYKEAKPIIVPYSYSTNSGTVAGYTLSDYPTGLASEVVDLHKEIIQEAVRIATSSTKDQIGYQIQTMEKQLQ